MSKPDNISQAIWDEANVVAKEATRDAMRDPLMPYYITVAPHIALALSQAYSRGLEDAAAIADKHAQHRRTNASDFKDIDQPHTASEAWEYAVDEALEIASEIRALGSK